MFFFRAAFVNFTSNPIVLLRFFSYNHIFTYVFLFLLTFALRAPSFHPQHFEDDESYYLVAAQKIVDGGVQYMDAWDNKPPLIVWVYSVFVWIFGPFAVWAIRIFACIYLYIGALFLNQMVVDNRLINRFSLLPAFLMIFLCSVPWYTQELNGEILMNVPVILAVMQLLRLQERSSRNATYLFVSGLLLGVAFIIKYQAIFIFIGLGAAYLSTQPPRLSETFSFVTGFLSVVVVTVVGIYLTGALEAFWDLGVLYNLDYIRIGHNPGEETHVLFNLGQYGQLWGIFMVLALVGIAHFRLTYFTNGIRLRKVEAIVLYWFCAALLALAIGGGRLYLHYFYLLVPPLAIYAAKALEIKLRSWVRNLVLLGAFAIPMMTYGVFLLSAFPNAFQWADPYLNPNGWVADFRTELNEPHPLLEKIKPADVDHGILVLAYEPTFYTRLQLPCATPYTNFSVAYFKMEIMPEYGEVGLISQTESMGDIHRKFQADMPDYIIDPLNLFPRLERSIPLLFGQYQGEVVDEGKRSYKIYKRQVAL